MQVKKQDENEVEIAVLDFGFSGEVHNDTVLKKHVCHCEHQLSSLIM